MTAHNYQPGEVWLVSEGGDSPVPALADSHGWSICNTHRTERSGARWCASEMVEPVRRLLLIDPEDREQVEDLCRRYVEAYGGRWDGREKPVTDMQAALRSLIAPPKVDEPLGLGAVVATEVDGDFIRVSLELQNPWHNVQRGTMHNWHGVAAVRVLSEGVTP